MQNYEQGLCEMELNVKTDDFILCGGRYYEN